MNVVNLKNWLICMAMLIASFAALQLTPRIKLAEQHKKVNLETIIPTQFNDWKIDESTSLGFINPQVGTELAEIYSQTLSRTYINSTGDRVMLSIAYGDNQSRKLQVHRPEVCYSAQGFRIGNMSKGEISTTSGTIPVMQLLAQQGARNEPITYWVLIGEYVVRGNLEQGLARLRYGVAGYIPDGLLFRVSMISSNTNYAFELQQSFINDLMKVIPQNEKSSLVGRFLK